VCVCVCVRVCVCVCVCVARESTLTHSIVQAVPCRASPSQQCTVYATIFSVRHIYMMPCVCMCVFLCRSDMPVLLLPVLRPPHTHTHTQLHSDSNMQRVQ